MDIIKSLYRFSLFFNFFIFVLSVITAKSITSIPAKFKIGSVNFSFDINLITMIFVILGIFAVIILAGTQVLGTGLSDSSIQLLIRLTAYIVIWIVLSIFSLSFLYYLEDFGNVIYVVLTIGYTLGFLQSLALGGNSNNE